MAVAITCEKSSRPGCVSVSVLNSGGGSQILVDAIRNHSVSAQYDVASTRLDADITMDKLEQALKAAQIETNPPHEQLLGQASQLFTGRAQTV